MTLTSVQLLTRYHILRPLGQGGMGATYQVSDSRLGGKIMALKGLSDAARHQSAGKGDGCSGVCARSATAGAPRPSQHPQGDGLLHGDGETLPGDGVRVRRDTRSRPGPPGRPPVGETEARDWALQLCDVLTNLHSQNPPVIFR